MKNIVSLTVVGLIILFSTNLKAQESPFQLSLFDPIQIVPNNESVSGIRLNLIYTKNVNVTGFDMGLVNVTTGKTAWCTVGRC